MTEIIAILGKRKSGKTSLSEAINSINYNYKRISMMAFLTQSFLAIQNITPEQYLPQQELEWHRYLLGVYSDRQRLADKNIFLRPLLEAIKPLSLAVVDDICYFNELEALIALKAKIVLVHTANDVRKGRGWLPHLDEAPLEQEVSTIPLDTVKAWGGQLIDNNAGFNALRAQIAPQVASLC